MKPFKDMGAGELAACLASHLQKRGISVVLSGGACVTIYSQNKYVSLDLDFVATGFVPRKQLVRAMSELGFQEKGRHFAHPDTHFLVDFPGGPLSTGKEPVSKVLQLQFASGILPILSPTDCVKDRLAGYYHWGDLQCLEQAVLVALANPIDLQEVKRWSKREGKLAEFAEIKGRLAGQEP